MTYGYIRVSTDKQTVENQRFEITDFCRRNNLKIDSWIEETIIHACETLSGKYFDSSELKRYEFALLSFDGRTISFSKNVKEVLASEKKMHASGLKI